MLTPISRLLGDSPAKLRMVSAPMIPPIFERLRAAKTVLIAGAGGGFDVYAGLPLYFWLRAQGATVHLANLSFADLSHAAKRHRRTPDVVAVQPDTSGRDRYFPERYLAQWLEQEGCPQPVYAIERGGGRTVRRAYEWLAAELKFDTLVLIDGGTDIVMRGDEFGLGTPEEDIASLAAGQGLEGPQQKFVFCLGFGVDTYHGVCHAHFLENVAALSVTKHYLGSWSLLWEMPEVRRYAAAVEFAQARLPEYPSVVSSSILSALRGYAGDHHATQRTRGTRLFISPLMAQYWAFDLPGLAARHQFIDRVGATETYGELTAEIARFRGQLRSERPWIDIPH